VLHIVFQRSDIDTLKKAIELDDSLRGEIIQIEDEFAVGPLADIFKETGYNDRITWWRNVLEFSPYSNTIKSVDDRERLHSIEQKLSADDHEQVWIWVAPNQHDVCGYYWLISQLKAHEGRIYILFLNNLPFINDKGGIFYPTNIFEIPPGEFIKAKKLARPLTISEFELDGDEWNRLCGENGIVRVSDGGKKIINKTADYYDDDILKAITNEPQKLQKIFHTLFGKMKVKTGDAFLAWRMRELINAGKIEMTGDWKNRWKEITMKLPAPISEDEKPELDITV